MPTTRRSSRYTESIARRKRTTRARRKETTNVSFQTLATWLSLISALLHLYGDPAVEAWERSASQALRHLEQEIARQMRR